MKKFLAIFSVLLWPVLPVAAPVGHATDEVPIVQPSTLLSSRHNPSIVNGQGIVWDQNYSGAASRMVSYTMQPGGLVSPSALCTTINETGCSPTTHSSLSVSSVLGRCQSSAEIGCIEGISMSIGTGSASDLTFVTGGTDVFAEVPANSIPRGSSMSLWRAADGSQYVVAVVVNTTLNPQGTTWSGEPSQVLMNIFRIPAADSVPVAVAGVQGVTGGVPKTIIEFPPASRFTLKVRLPDSVPKWFLGRLDAPVIGSTVLSGGRSVYEISGGALKVQVAGVEASSDEIGYPASGNKSGYRSYYKTPVEIDDYAIWKSVMKDTAIASVSEWALSSMGVSMGDCSISTPGVGGIATTNAAFISPAPPTYNATTGGMEFNVASPHYDSNSAVAVGTYSLSMSADAVKCMYRTDTMPDVATAETRYENGEAYTVTQNLSLNNGWLNMKTDGFHFSSPRIGVKFMVKNSKGVAVPLPISPVRAGKLKRGQVVPLSKIAVTSPKQKAKWSAQGQCSVKGSKLVSGSKKGTCTLLVSVLGSDGKMYTPLLRKKFSVS